VSDKFITAYAERIKPMSSTTRPYTLYMPLIIADRKLRNAIKVAVEALPGFVRWEGEDFTQVMDCAPLAVFCNCVCADDARAAIEQQTWTGSKKLKGQIKTIIIEPLSIDLQPSDLLDAAMVAFKLTPSATRYVALQNEMLAYQSAHPINAEGTQR
jgi:hypothetical protein